MNGFGTHTINYIGRHLVGICQLIDISYVGSAADRSTHCVIVVLANEYHRQFPQHSQVEGFMQHTLAGSSITKISQYHIVSTTVLFCEGQPGACTDLGAYDTMSPVKILFLTKKVHASTFTLRTSCGFAIQFSHTGIYRYPFSNGQTVIAVSSDEHIFWFCGSHTSGSYRFLPYIGMKETADLSFHLILFFCHELKLADELH